MPILSKGSTFATGNQVTAANLNALVDSATFAAGAVDTVTTELASGAIRVKDGGITPTKLSTYAPTWGLETVRLTNDGFKAAVGFRWLLAILKLNGVPRYGNGGLRSLCGVNHNAILA